MKATVHPRHSQNCAFSAFRCCAALWLRLQDAMLMEMALPSSIHAGRLLLFTDHIPRSLTCKYCIAKRVTVNGVNSNGRFSCEHEIGPQEWTSEL